MLTKEERIDKALAARKEGYTCSQAMVIAFPDVVGEGYERVLDAALGLGAGCGIREICGVISGMGLVLSCRAEGKPAKKGDVYNELRELSEKFQREFGAVRCEELKGKTPPRPCNDLIIAGISMLHDHIFA